MSATAFDYPEEIRALREGLAAFIRAEVAPRHEANAHLLEDEHRKFTPEGRYHPEVLKLLRVENGVRVHPTFDAAFVYGEAQRGLAALRDDALPRLLEQWRALQGREPGPDADWVRLVYAERRLSCALLLARLLLQYGRAPEAMNIVRQVDTSLLWEDRRQSELLGLEFLAVIINGTPLNQAPEGETPNPQRITSYSQPGGPFSDMLNSESDVALLRSPLFDAALRQRGVSYEEFRPELTAAIRPERVNYGSYYYGGLRAGAL